MFLVFLRFGENRDRAPELMAAHNEWIRKGFEDGVFLMVGSLQPPQGGVVMAHATDRVSLEARVAEDPFVAEGVVSAEIHGVMPAKADERLSFLLS